MKYRQQWQKQAGLTLVEVMISLAISTVVIGAAIQVLVSSKQNYRFIESMSRMQEDARYILDVLAVDVRMTGLNACGRDGSQVNVLNGKSTNAVYDVFSNPLQGFENGDDFSFSGLPSEGAGAAVDDADVLWIKGLDTATQYFVSSHDTATYAIELNQASDFAAGDMVLVCQPGASSVFQVSSVSTDKSTIYHAVTSGQTPGNCTDLLGSEPSSCASGNGAAFVFNTLASAYRITEQAFFVGVSSDGNHRSLWRAEVRANASGDLEIAVEELIAGVVGMELVYGEDTDADGVIDEYVDADAVTDWDQVLGLRVSLVFSSIENNIVDSAVDYVVEGETITPSDKRLYKVFSSTIGIRNRVL